MTKKIPFIENEFYYLRAQTIGSVPVFNNAGLCEQFLETYWNFVSGIFDTYAYNFLENQFHFVVKLRDCNTGTVKIETGKLISSFTQSFNHSENRVGGLFVRPLHWDMIPDFERAMQLIKHIHRLPVEYGLVDSPEKWRYSSYPYLINHQASFIQDDEIRQAFSSLDKLITFHQIPSTRKPDFTIQRLRNAA